MGASVRVAGMTQTLPQNDEELVRLIGRFGRCKADRDLAHDAVDAAEAEFEKCCDAFHEVVAELKEALRTKLSVHYPHIIDVTTLAWFQNEIVHSIGRALMALPAGERASDHEDLFDHAPGLEDWLDEHCGPGGYWLHSGTILHFRDASAAVHFKLRWY